MSAARATTPFVVALLVAAGCGASAEVPPEVEPLAGGATTIVDNTASAFRNPAPNLDEAQLDRHLEGDVAFDAKFVASPAPVNAGLGPLFNNTGCSRCHVRDGRGLPVLGSGPIGSPMLVRVSNPTGSPEAPGGANPVPGLGTQLQDHATHGHAPEATIGVRWIAQSGTYGDGESFTLRRPALEIVTVSGAPLSRDVMTSARIAPPVFGLGLLEAVSDESILAMADPDDRDGDGISGRANMTWDVVKARSAVGRFGWKAGIPSLLQQTAAAYANDMGVGNALFPDSEGAVELDRETLEAAAFYTQTLAVPRRRAVFDADVRRGEVRFRNVGCAKCHVETLQTGDHPVSALRHQTIHPYSDLLVHNMGFELADGRPEYVASATEWRTAPLWGIGLTQIVLTNACFLHDGRARSFEEAILWHGGEAEASREAFRMLSRSERDAVLAFLRSL